MALKGTGLLLVLTLLLFAARMYAARLIGFGDSEALYACYALHPQAAYLDHPGLVGVLAVVHRRRGASDARGRPCHHDRGARDGVFPWLVFVVARRLGAEVRPAAIAAMVVAVTPEIAVGLFAMTPDLPLAYLWLGFLGTAALAFESEPRGVGAAALFLVAGVCAGASATAKVTGALLLPAFAVSIALDPKHRRTIWPWLGLAVRACSPCSPSRATRRSRAFPCSATASSTPRRTRACRCGTSARSSAGSSSTCRRSSRCWPSPWRASS